MAHEIRNHPGRYIKESVLPKGLSVKDAAQLLGVGRPALSNLLNGRAALSPDMAARIERAFRIPAQDLIDRQAAYAAAQAKTKGASVTTKKYVPPFYRSRPTRSKSGRHPLRRARASRFSSEPSSTRRAWA